MGNSTSNETQTATQTIPPEVTAANQAMLARGQRLADLGYIPYMGVDVAGINPAERAAMENVGTMANAFGLAAPAEIDIGMPEVTVGGMTGYSGFPIYEGALERFRETRPAQYNAYAEALGYDPLTGERKAPPPPPVQVSSGGGGVPYNPFNPLSGRKEYGFSGGWGDPSKPAGVSSRLDTKGQIGKYEGMSQATSIKDSVSDFVKGGGLMGAIGRAMSKKD